MVLFLLVAAALTAGGCGKQDELFDREVSAWEDVTSGPAEVSPTLPPEEPKEPEEIFVDVCGAVMQPGVVRLKPGSRVYQAVEAAGGFSPEAASARINQARSLQDGEQVYVPTLEEAADTGGAALPSGPDDPGPAGSSAGGTGVDLTGKININTADITALMTLDGIGKAKAQAILDYRMMTGTFGSIEDIKKVSGIGDGIYNKIKDSITIG